MPRAPRPVHVPRLDASLWVRLTEREREKVRKAAAKLGMREGPLVRALVLDGLDRLDEAGVQRAALKESKDTAERARAAGKLGAAARWGLSPDA